MKKQKDTYSVKVILGGRNYTSEGETPIEALSSLQLPRLRGRGIVVLKHGKKVVERVVSPAQMFMLTHSGGKSREIALTRTAQVFDGL